MNMFGLISPLMAQSTTAPAANVGFNFQSLLLPVLLIAVFYFLILRPQQKRMKQQREMLSGLRRGDKVLTSGGILGTINKIENDREVYVEISPNVVVRMTRSGIADVITSTEAAGTSPVATKAEAKSAETAPEAKKSNVTPLKKSAATKTASKPAAASKSKPPKKS